MTTNTHRTGAHSFVAYEVAIEIVESLRDLVATIRRHNAKIADQIVASASSISANVLEGNRRRGRDRLHLFRVAAGSADETRAHLRVAVAWGWLRRSEVERTMALIDRELGLLWGLTH
jgi:four helix bundle protein